MPTQSDYIRHMEYAGTHAAWLTTLAPKEGQQKPETFAQLAGHYMRLAGVSPFNDNLNLNV
jgi:hypothetical protein